VTSLKFLRFLKDKLETPYVVSYFFNGLPRRGMGRFGGGRNWADGHQNNMQQRMRIRRTAGNVNVRAHGGPLRLDIYGHESEYV
jgi:hypothetical protein